MPGIMKAKTEDLNLIELLVHAFIGVALIEEFSKWIMTYLISYNSEEFDEVYDIIIYSVFVSLGFAAFENILYVAGGGVVTAVARALLSVPGHACNGIFMGYFFGLAKLSEINNNEALKRKNLALSLIAPTILHGIFDYCLMTQRLIFLLVFLLFIFLLYKHANKKLKQYSNISRKMKYKNNYCPNCGTVVNNNFCPNCGHKHE